ncbi:hypothetical protein HMPREF1550_01418 [Actinomyces sp. oral taxon 877 str. F0543]|nr:hypothetical protein HMPREF1550_01418 [Actinomyces sp. oral taxon 877 str. F0543]
MRAAGAPLRPRALIVPGSIRMRAGRGRVMQQGPGQPGRR